MIHAPTTTINAEIAEHAEENRLLRSPRSLRSNVDKALFLLITALVCAAQPAFAQDGWAGRARVSINVGAQIDTERLSESITLTKYVEPTPVTAEIPRAAVPFFDIGLAVRVAGNFGAAIAVSYLTNTDDADVRAQIPHPFYFGQPREIAGTASRMKHNEAAAHTNLVYVIASPRIDLMLFGGASFFRVEQSFVSDVIFSEEYPYDTATFMSATVTKTRASKAGYNAGADVTWKLSPRWGVGGLIRFARARVPFGVDDHDFGRVDVGGLQAGAGVRLLF